MFKTPPEFRKGTIVLYNDPMDKNKNVATVDDGAGYPKQGVPDTRDFIYTGKLSLKEYETLFPNTQVSENPNVAWVGPNAWITKTASVLTSNKTQTKAPDYVIV